MYKNLLKGRTTYINKDNLRIIDTNELIEQKLRNTAQIVAKETEVVNSGEFSDGLNASIVEVLATDPENDLPVYEGPGPEELMEEAKAEIAKMQEDAVKVLETERKNTLEEAMTQGYQEGHAKAMQENQAKEAELKQIRNNLEQQYQNQIDKLEPEFIDTLTGIYEHIFKVDLKDYREIIVHLINSTLRKIEGSKEFIVHVSKDDYPYAGMQKKQILSGVGSGNLSVEIIEDMTLRKNECLIETDGGIFDCSLGTELEGLSRKLKLLSYERATQQE